MRSSLSSLLERAGSRFVSAVLGSLNVIVLARALEAEGRGRYFLFVATVAVIIVVADLGLSQSAIVYAGKGGHLPGDTHCVLLAAAGVLSVAVATVSGVAVVLGADRGLVPNLPHGWGWMAAIVVPAGLYSSFWSGMMIGTQSLKDLNAIQLGVAASALLLNLALVVALQGGVTAALGVYVAVVVGQSVAMFALARRRIFDVSEWSVRVRLGREMVTFGLRGYPGTLSTLLWTRSSIFLLNAYQGAAVVGVFSVAQQLAERMLLPAQALQDVVFGKITGATRTVASVMVDRYVRIVLWSMALVAGVVALLAPWLMRLLLRDAHEEAATMFRVLLLGSLAMSVSVLLVPYFLGQLRRPGLLSVLAWINVLLNLILATALIPPFGGIGAAAALVGTQILGTSIVVAVYLRSAHTRLARTVWLRSEDLILAVRQARALLFAWRSE